MKIMCNYSYETDPAALRLASKWDGMEATSFASFKAVSKTEWPTESPPATILSHLPGHVGFESERR